MARHRSPARFLAPLALVAAIVAVVLVVQAARPGGDDSAATSTTQGDPTSSKDAATSTSRTTRGPSPKRRSYVVKAGDSLSAVADEVGVSVARLQELNPELDAQSLQVGQRIKLTGSTQSP
jgi:LysM repeat protein